MILALANLQFYFKLRQDLVKQDLRFYISGEEAASQVKLRAKRLGLSTAPIRLGSETNLRNILTTFEDEEPNLVIMTQFRPYGLTQLTVHREVYHR